MPITFSTYLQNLREEMDLTQQNLLDLLTKNNSLFKKLDLTTLSRWERAITIPNLKKQLAIARLFNSDITQLINPNTPVPTVKKKILEQFHERVFNPYSENQSTLALTKLKTFNNEEQLYNNINNFHEHFLGINTKNIDFKQKTMDINIFTDKENNLVAHCLFGYTKTNINKDLYKFEEIENCDFIKKSDEKTVNLYVFSAFSSLKKSRMAMLLMLIKKLSINNNIKSFIINMHYQEVLNLISVAEHDIINKGPRINSGGVKIFGNNYSFVQALVNAESFLASPMISSLIENIDEHLNSLAILGE